MPLLRPTPLAARHGRSSSSRGERLGRCAAIALALWAVLGVSLAVGGGGGASTEGVDEYTLKAAILSKFVKLVNWPEERLGDKAPLVLAVYGEDPFGKRLDEIFAKRKDDERKVVLKRLSKLEELAHAHVVFLPQGEMERLSEVLKVTQQAGVLLIGESDGFAARGGAINFYTEEDKVRFEINPEAAKRQKLKISSDLLKLARIVKDKE